MDVLSLQEMLAREDEAFRSGLTAAALMEAAGKAMTRRILILYPACNDFLILANKGNNGGDGLVVAWHLAEAEKKVRVVLAAPEDQLGDLPKSMLEQLRKKAPEMAITPWNDGFNFPDANGVVIDALLGLQAKGELREPLAGIVKELNAARARNFFRTVALDLPSGLAGYETEIPSKPDAAVIADVTISVGFAKTVLCREPLAEWVGRIEVVPWSNDAHTKAPRQVLLGHELTSLLPRRGALSHKGTYGRLAIIAGSRGFTGAPILCTQAAQAMGAGLLSVVTHPTAYENVAAKAPPEAMVSAWPPVDDAPEPVKNASAIVLGPGLGVDAETGKMLRAALAIECPLLIDADGLNVLAQNLDLLSKAKGPVVLTPHPGEMTRLLGRKFTPDEREAVAKAFTERYDVTLVLKGTRTLIAARGESFYFNTTGNPGLSTGGSGDTLSGILGALLAQGLKPFDAARLGVWLHGHAADLALVERGCEEGLTPTMVSAHLGVALVSLRTQAAKNFGLVERAKSYLKTVPTD